MPRKPDRLRIDKSDRKLYNEVAEELFAGEERKDQFLMAMSYGFRNDVCVPLKTGDGFFRTEYLQPEDMTLINSIAIHKTGGVQVLSDLEVVFRIAEEYAHAGIKLLHEQVTSQQPGSYIKRFEKEVFDLYEELNAD